MRKYTKRQIQEDSVKEISNFLENLIQDIIERSEKLLSYNGSKNQRISEECIKAVIKSKYNSLLPEKVGSDIEKKERKYPHLYNKEEVIYL
jgi:hypothetical protein